MLALQVARRQSALVQIVVHRAKPITRDELMHISSWQGKDHSLCHCMSESCQLNPSTVQDGVVKPHIQLMSIEGNPLGSPFSPIRSTELLMEQSLRNYAWACLGHKPPSPLGTPAQYSPIPNDEAKQPYGL